MVPFSNNNEVGFFSTSSARLPLTVMETISSRQKSSRCIWPVLAWAVAAPWCICTATFPPKRSGVNGPMSFRYSARQSLFFSRSAAAIAHTMFGAGGSSRSTLNCFWVERTRIIRPSKHFRPLDSLEVSVCSRASLYTCPGVFA